MKILFGIWHPAHVHLFKNTINKLKKKGHEVKIIARDKDITLELLDKLNYDYQVISPHKKSFISKFLDFFIRWKETYYICLNFKPDLAVGVADIYFSQIGKFLGFKSLVLTDTEHVKLDKYLLFPFADYILTPKIFNRHISRSQIKYDSYHELAYLHPNYFTPDINILEELGISKGEQFVIFRFVSWDAAHDIGTEGLHQYDKVKLVLALSAKYRIFISSESTLPKELAKYEINLSPEKIHHVLSFSSLFIGDGATMASECSVLGTPAIYINPLSAGTIIEQEQYGILFHITDTRMAIDKALQILSMKSSKNFFRKISSKIISEKIDMTKFLTDRIVSR